MVVNTEWFKRALDARGMSQRDIAGVEQARFSRLINGKVAPSAAEVVAIARALFSSTAEVLRRFGFAPRSQGKTGYRCVAIDLLRVP